MVKLQKIEKKKLAIYVIIIAAALALIGFLIYRNYFLADQGDLPALDTLGAGNKEEFKIKNGGNGHILDDGDIFNNPKFRALRNNSVTRTKKINIGKENPFEPY